MLLAMFLLATFPFPQEEVNSPVLVAALRTEDIEVPPPKAVGPSFPRSHRRPNPNRRFTRKG